MTKTKYNTIKLGNVCLILFFFIIMISNKQNCKIIANWIHLFFRLGGSEADIKEIVVHSFFSNINWQDLYDKKVRKEYVHL